MGFKKYVPSRNLFDINRLPSDTWTTDTRYYMNGGIATSKNVDPTAVTISMDNDTLSVTTTGGNGAGFLVEVKPSTIYRLVFTKSESLASNKTSCAYTFLDTYKTIGQTQLIYGDTDGVVFTTNSDTKYVYFVFRKAAGTISYSNIMLSEGQTSLPYEPYGNIWQPITPKKLKGVPYTGTLPATLTGTKARYLHKYKVYGNSASGQECGERTENLFNLDRQPSNTWTLDTAYYINGGVANEKTVNPSLVTIEINNNELTVSSPSASSRGAGFVVPVTPSTSYTISCNTSGASVGDTESVIVFGFITQNGTITRYDAARGSNPIHTLTTNDDEYYVYLVFRKMSGTLTYSNIMLTEGSIAPTSYIPYGYKLPLTSGSASVDIYVGDDTLSTEEYIDSGAGKIYRMVDGVLTPTDPPVPFPQIPTSANSTTISWAGEGLAPSQFDSIQEWVEISTYKRVGGAWVADN